MFVPISGDENADGLVASMIFMCFVIASVVFHFVKYYPVNKVTFCVNLMYDYDINLSLCANM